MTSVLRISYAFRSLLAVGLCVQPALIETAKAVTTDRGFDTGHLIMMSF